MSPQHGDLLHNRYELMDLIATGGMGEVWRAHDGRLNRDVAVKLLKPELASQKGFLDRFRIEARNAALLTHPNVCAVFDYGEAETEADGESTNTAYLVMELVPGEPLSSIITREAPLEPGRVLDYMRQAAAGLGAAHAAGVVHRDVKPGNLLVTPDGTVKITDFGVARASGQSNLTATGQVMGTAQYLAPEQALGERVTPAADVYSLGVVGYQALTGAVPFVRESQVATALAQVNDTPPPLPATLPRGVRDLIMGLLRKEPQERPANGRDLAAAVAAVQAGYQPDLPEATAPTRVQTAPTVAMRRGQTQPSPPRRQAPSSAAPVPTGRRGRARLPLVFLLGLLVLIVAWAAYNSYAKGSDPSTPRTSSTQHDRVTTKTVTSNSTTGGRNSPSRSSSSTSGPNSRTSTSSSPAGSSGTTTDGTSTEPGQATTSGSTGTVTTTTGGGTTATTTGRVPSEPTGRSSTTIGTTTTDPAVPPSTATTTGGAASSTPVSPSVPPASSSSVGATTGAESSPAPTGGGLTTASSTPGEQDTGQ